MQLGNITSLTDLARYIGGCFRELQDRLAPSGGHDAHSRLTDTTDIIALRNSAAIVPGTFLQEGQIVGRPGAVVVYDPTDATFDVLVQIQTNDSGLWVTLLPGKPYDIRPRAFREFRLRYLKRVGSVLSVPAGTFLGKLLVGTDLDANILGATPAAAVYGRGLPSSLFGATRTLTAIGALGIFSFRDTLPGTLDGQCIEIRYQIDNDGPTDIYIGFGAAIIVDNGSNRSAVKKIKPGQQWTLTRRGRPAGENSTRTPVDDDVFVYSDDAVASYSHTREEVFVW